MARTELDRTVQPSLLDRLTDDDPRTPADSPISRDESVRRYRNSVLRDVEWLLNTRRTATDVPDALAALRDSAFNYGLPDTTGIPIGSAKGRARLLRSVEHTLATYEPRLAEVRVVLADADQVRSPQVTFLITALLRMDPSPEQVLFDTVLDIASGGYVVRDGPASAG